MMPWTRTLVLALAAAVAAGGTLAHSASGAVTPVLDRDATVAVADRDAPSGHFDGTLPSGATWVADVPENWNGTTVLFSHGFGPLVAQNAPDDATRAALLERGYALAGSSYSGDTWWALETALHDQRRALRKLERIIGKARQTIAWGQSMGGLVSALTAESAWGRVDGALTTCGIVGGALDLNEYQLHGAHAIAELLAPGQDIRLVDYASTDQAQAAAAQLAQAVSAAQGSPEGRARIALAAAYFNLPDWFSSPQPPAADDYEAQVEQQAQQLSSFVLSFVLFGRWHIEASAGGNSSATVGADYADLLADSRRRSQVEALYAAAGLDLGDDLAHLADTADIEREPAAVRSLARTSVPTGRIKAPQLTIHTVADPIVPVEHEGTYRERVRSAGRSVLLRQAYIHRSGHCAFEPSETVAALEQLQIRIKTGRWPHISPDALNEAARATGLAGTPAYVELAPTSLAASFPIRPRRGASRE